MAICGCACQRDTFATAFSSSLLWHALVSRMKGFRGEHAALKWALLSYREQEQSKYHQAAVLLMLDPKTPFQAAAIFLGGVAVAP